MPFVKIPKIPEIRIDRLKAVFYVLLIASSIAITIFLLSRIKIRRYGFVTAKYLKFRSSLKRKGANIMTSSTPSDVMKEAVRLGMSDGLADFISLYERARFGGWGMNDEEKKRYSAMF